MLKQIFQLFGHIRKGVLFIALVFLAIPSHATKYWVSKSTGNWNNNNNWSIVSGGAGKAGVPVSTDSVVFDGNGIGTCTINTSGTGTSSIVVSSFTISTNSIGGFTSTIIELSTVSVTAGLDFAVNNGTFSALTSSMTVSSSVYVNAGVFNLAGTSVTVGGNMTIYSTAAFYAGTSTVTFSTSTINHTIATGGFPFYNLLFNGTGSWVLTSSMTVTSTMTFSKGTLDSSSSNCPGGIPCNVSAGGSWYILGGTYTAHGSTVTFTAGTAQKIRSGGESFSNLQFSGTNGSWVLQDSMTVTSNMTLSAGTLNTSANNLGITVGGSWSNTGGAFTVNSSTVIFNGSTAGNAIYTSGYPFYNLWINGSGSWVLTSSMTTTSTMTFSNGTLSSSSNGCPGGTVCNVSAGGSWYVLGGTYTANGSTVTFTAATAANQIKNGAENFYNVQFNGAAASTWILQDSMTVTSTMTLSVGTLNTKTGNTSNPISIGGSWYNTGGAFTANGSTVTFTSTTPGMTIRNKGFPFNAVTFGSGGTGGYWTLVDSMTVSTATITPGFTFNLAGQGLKISSFTNAGSFILQSLEGVTSAPMYVAGASVTYTATSGLPLVFSTWTYSNLLINGGSGTTFSVTPTSLTVLGSLSLLGGTLDPTANNYPIGVGQNWLYTAGAFTARISTVTFTGSTAGNTITTGGYPFANLQINGSGSWVLNSSITVISTMTFSNGTLSSSSNCPGSTPCNVQVGGSWFIAGGTFTAVSSTVTFSTTTAQQIRSGGESFYNLQFANTGSWVMLDSMTVTSTMTLSAGTLNTKTGNTSNPISVGGSWSNTGGAFTANASTVTFTSTTPGMTIQNKGFPFNAVTFGSGGTGGYWTLVDSMTVSTATITPGFTFNLAGQGLKISSFTNAGSFVLQSLEGVTSAPMYVAGASVTYTATSGSPLVFSTWTYSNLLINGGSGTTFSVTPTSLTVLGSLSLLGGTLDTTAAGNYPIGVGQNWVYTAGAFHAESSTVSFTGSTAGNTITTGGYPFYNLQINGTGSWILNSSITVTSTMTFSNGTLSSSSNCPGSTPCNVSAGGSWYVLGGTFTANSSTVTFTATTPQQIRSGGENFYNLQLNGTNGTWVMLDSMTVTSSFVLSAGSFTSNANASYGISVGGNWNFNGGTLVLNQSTVTLTGAGTANLTGSTTFYSLSCTVGGKTITLPINSTQTVTNLLTLTGASGNLIQVNSSQSGQPAYLNNTGSNNVSYVNVQDNNANAGITISAGANSTQTGVDVFNWIFAAPNLSVTISPKPYDFTTVNLGATTVSTSAIAVKNNGTVTESFSLSVSTTGAQTVWGVGTGLPTTFNTFVLFGVFNSTQPTPGNFVAGDVIISTPTAATTSIYALNQTGYRTSVGSSESLWLRLDMPPTTSTTTQQQMNLSVTASYP